MTIVKVKPSQLQGEPRNRLEISVQLGFEGRNVAFAGSLKHWGIWDFVIDAFKACSTVTHYTNPP